jgi:hypothetical protein
MVPDVQLTMGMATVYLRSVILAFGPVDFTVPKTGMQCANTRPKCK